MALNELKDEVQTFMTSLKNKCYDKKTIIELIDKDLLTLKENLNTKSIVDHKLYDLLFLIFELAVHNKTDLDLQWDEGKKRKNKYLN
jgi:hypothetical protein